MLRRYSRVIAAIVVCFFTWTSGGVFSVAHAAQAIVKQEMAKNQPKAQKVGAEERLSKLTEELTEALASQATEVEAKRSRLAAAKTELETLDVEIRKQFAVTEKRLKDAKLPAEIMQRHYRFVKHYDENLAELKGNIDRVEKAKDKKQAEAEIERTRVHLEKVKAPSRHQKLDPNNLPFRQPKVIKREPRMKKEEFERDLKKDKNAWRYEKRIRVASTGPLTGLLPSDDLSETTEVLFTPEIKAKAQELGNNPVKIYEWVRNNFEFESYYGSMKGAQQSLLEKSGNDFDQASVLIALLRSSNIQARYVYGTIEAPIEAAMTWLGVKDPLTAANIVASAGIPAKASMNGGKIRSILMEHVWVEARVSMYPSFGAKNGLANAWIAIDPSIKDHYSYTSTDISKIVPFDESVYLRTQSKISPSLSYLFTMEDYRSANFQGSIQDILYLKGIKEQKLGVLLGTLPYKIVTVGDRFDSINQSYRHSVSIALRDPATGESTSSSKNLCQLSGKKITVSFLPATNQDEAVMASYGGILKTPGYLVKIKAVVKVEDSVVLESPTVQMGDSLRLSVGFNTPGSFTDSVEKELALGIFHNIALSALNVADTQVVAGLDRSNNLLGNFYDSINTGDDEVGKVLRNIGLQYFSHTNNASRLLERMMHIYNTRGVNAGFVSVAAQYRELFGKTVSAPIISGLVIDIPRYIQSPFSVSGDFNQEKAFTKIQGLNTSYFEHAIWESFSGIDTVSTVKLLQLANEAGIPIYNISSANINTLLPTLNQSQSVKEEIRDAVASGNEVSVPKSYISLNEWSGTGYMIRNPDTGEGTYKLSNGLYGGAGTKSPVSSALGLLARQYAALAEGRPARNLEPNSGLWNLWGGALLDEVTMIAIADMLLAKGYIPVFREDFSKQELIDHLNREENAIIYYSGHSASGDSGDSLVPGWNDDLQQSPQYVMPSDINAPNARLVFLNSCKSTKAGSFGGAFGINNKLLMGWNNSIEYWESSYFGLMWWMNMFRGFTAFEAAFRVGTNGKYTQSSGEPALDNELKVNFVRGEDEAF